MARSQDGNVRLPMMLVATVKCSPCGPVKNEQSVALRIAVRTDIFVGQTTWAFIDWSKVAAIATSIYCPRPSFAGC
jgi:hypothetical protein